MNNPQSVVIYTPAQNILYNTDMGAMFLIWAISVGIALFIVAAGADRRNLKPWQFAGLVGCAAFTIKSGIVWALVNL